MWDQFSTAVTALLGGEHGPPPPSHQHRRAPGDALASYLSDVAAQLYGPRRRREAILAELRDGLEQATEDNIAAGLSPDQAAAAAITQFGTPEAVADAFGGELATAYARRTIAWFIATGPARGNLVAAPASAKPLAHRPDRTPRGHPRPPAAHHRDRHRRRNLATTGRLMRWLPETGPRRALAATIAIAAMCIIGDLTMITMFMVSDAPTRPLAVIAIAASLTRIACSITTVRHATRMRSRSPGMFETANQQP